MSNFQLQVSQNNQNHSSSHEIKRWDHSGFDQLQREEQQGKWHKTKSHRKQQPTRDGEIQKGNNNPSAYELNRQRENLSAKAFSSNAQKSLKVDRKPDRQLYSVRGKRTDTQNESICADERNSKMKSKTEKGKEELLLNDDKSFVSNVSTADGRDEKILTENENVLGSIQIANQGDCKVLLTLGLGVENDCEMIVIYENEENYESFLDEVCARHGILERAALCFKINVLQMICDVHPNPSKVTPSLNKLLDINYNLIISESREEFLSGNSPCHEQNELSTEDSCDESC